MLSVLKKSLKYPYYVFKQGDCSFQHLSLKKIDSCRLVSAGAGICDSSGAAHGCWESKARFLLQWPEGQEGGGAGTPIPGELGHMLPPLLLPVFQPKQHFRSMTKHTKSFKISSIALRSCFVFHHPADTFPKWLGGAASQDAEGFGETTGICTKEFLSPEEHAAAATKERGQSPCRHLALSVPPQAVTQRQPPQGETSVKPLPRAGE